MLVKPGPRTRRKLDPGAGNLRHGHTGPGSLFLQSYGPSLESWVREMQAQGLSALLIHQALMLYYQPHTKVKMVWDHLRGQGLLAHSSRQAVLGQALRPEELTGPGLPDYFTSDLLLESAQAARVQRAVEPLRVRVSYAKGTYQGDLGHRARTQLLTDQSWFDGQHSFLYHMDCKNYACWPEKVQLFQGLVIYADTSIFQRMLTFQRKRYEELRLRRGDAQAGQVADDLVAIGQDPENLALQLASLQRHANYLKLPNPVLVQRPFHLDDWLQEPSQQGILRGVQGLLTMDLVSQGLDPKESRRLSESISAQTLTSYLQEHQRTMPRTRVSLGDGLLARLYPLAGDRPSSGQLLGPGALRDQLLEPLAGLRSLQELAQL